MITIPFEILSMKNSKMIKINKATRTKFIGSRNIVISQMKRISLFMAANKEKWLMETNGLKPPYIICYKLYRKTLRKFDYNNITQLVFDCMTKSGWIEDDDMKNIIPIACGWEKDSYYPRMEFYIANGEEKKILEEKIFSLHNKKESIINNERCENE